jgi:tetratricopeptide (TPR) repeat protein
VEFTPQDYPDLAGWLNNLGNMLGSRFERTGRMEDLKEAIRKAQQAVEFTPENHPDLAMYLNNLGNKLKRRFKRTGRMEGLKKAIRKAQQAVKITPEDLFQLCLTMLESSLGRIVDIAGT